MGKKKGMRFWKKKKKKEKIRSGFMKISAEVFL